MAHSTTQLNAARQFRALNWRRVITLSPDLANFSLDFSPREAGEPGRDESVSDKLREGRRRDGRKSWRKEKFEISNLKFQIISNLKFRILNTKSNAAALRFQVSISRAQFSERSLTRSAVRPPDPAAPPSLPDRCRRKARHPWRRARPKQPPRPARWTATAARSRGSPR